MDEPLDLIPLDGIDLGYVRYETEEEADAAMAAKRSAIELLRSYGVYEDVSEAQAAEEELKYIRARWEHQRRVGTEDKWRYVAQEFAWQEQRDDCFAAASTSQTSRIVDFIALKEVWTTFGADCVKAYYQSEQLEKVCVKPPAEYIELLRLAGRPTDIVWKLHKMLPGLRLGGRGWVETATKRLEGEGFVRCEALPQFFR